MTDDLSLPADFRWLARTGDALCFYHLESRKVGRISGVAIAISPDAAALQAELNYQIAKTRQEIERDKEFHEIPPLRGV